VGGSGPRPARMARRLLQFRLRTLVILVALVALVLGAESTRRRWRSFRVQAAWHGQLAKNFLARANGLESMASQTGKYASGYVPESKWEAMTLVRVAAYRPWDKDSPFGRRIREDAYRYHLNADRETQLEEYYLRRW
jgi:hypothetical protein